MRNERMLLRALGVEGAVVEDVVWGGDTGELALEVMVRLQKKGERRCPHCRRRCARYDRGSGRRRWRALDVGLCPVYAVADAPRVRCCEHGVVVEGVPWARPGARFTRAFEDQVAWLAVRTDKSTLASLLRVAWRSVGRILERVAEERSRTVSPLANVTRIGVDEVSYRKGHRYLTIVVDHDSGRLLFAHPGKDEAALDRFFDELGPAGCERIGLASADAGAAYNNVVRRRCPNATVCLDPFHVVQGATHALDEVRRAVWNDLRAYLLKEELRSIFHDSDTALAKITLRDWLAWAARSRLTPFVKLARTIRTHLDAIYDVLDHGLSNARLEAAATKLRLLTRLAFGFHSHERLIAIAKRRLGGLAPPLPARP